ncbi:MAG: endonuclease III [Clostridia bacterium]
MEVKTKQIIDILKEEFPLAKSELIFSSPFELLISVILSAQCTDKRVNQVTKILFKRANTPQAMVSLGKVELEKLIFSCGFYHNKADHILSCSQSLIDNFNSNVPSSLKELLTLSGVGVKTANVVYAVGFGGQAIAVDTHVFRVSNRLGLAQANNVAKTEQQLRQAIDQELWSSSHHLLLLLGRYVCLSRKPKCEICRLSQLCEFAKSQSAINLTTKGNK